MACPSYILLLYRSKCTPGVLQQSCRGLRVTRGQLLGQLQPMLQEQQLGLDVSVQIVGDPLFQRLLEEREATP